MKFLDIFGFILLSVLLLAIGAAMMQGPAWTMAMKGTAVWFTQALAYSLAIVGVACAITGKKVRDLSNVTIFWMSLVVLVVALIGIGWTFQMGKQKELISLSLLELLIFYLTLLSLFLISRHNK